MKSIEIDTFKEIKEKTKGYLSPDVYEEIFKAAKNAPEGAVIDIGPAQGGSTVSLTLGRREAGFVPKIYSLDMFRKSKALRYWEETDKNIEVLRANLEHYGIADFVKIIAVGDKDPRDAIGDQPVSVMFIDADGALDRDFSLYYQQVVPGGAIILDDVKDVYNKHVNKYLSFNDEAEAKYVRTKGASSMRALVPLGKEYTTWKFSKALIDRGFLFPVKTVGSTFFTGKPFDPSLNERFQREIGFFDEVRDEIYREYLQKKREMQLKSR